MKNFLKLFMLLLAGAFFSTAVLAQSNAILNMQTLQLGEIYVNGAGSVGLTIGNTGPTVAIPIGKIRIQVSCPPNVTIPTGQLIPGWTIDYPNANTVNICNSGTTIPVGTAQTLILALIGGPTAGAGAIGGNVSFRTNCTGPGSLLGDALADNAATAGFNLISILPVTLLNFNATLSNCQPALNWQTESEINSDRFEIERGNLINSTWKSIGIVAAKGNGAAKSTYNFLDSDVDVSSEKILYRLKMIDKDGQYKYSKILPVLINCKTKQVEVYPNPVQDGRLYINVTGASGYTEATLLSLTGQVIIKQVIKNGTNYLNIAPGVSAGLYLLNVKDENGIDKKTKVLIQH